METGAEAVRLIETGAAGPVAERSGPRHLLFLDADLADSAAEAGPLADPVRAGTADMTIAVFTTRVRIGGFGIVTAAAGAGIERATGWRPAQPLNGQRCLTRAAFTAALPLAAGWGAETGMTIDLLRKGMRVAEVEVPLSHRATGNDWRSQLHRLHQLADVCRALLVASRPSRDCAAARSLAARRTRERAEPGDLPVLLSRSARHVHRGCGPRAERRHGARRTALRDRSRPRLTRSEAARPSSA